MKFKSYEDIVEEMLLDFAKEFNVEYISSASDIAIKAKIYAAQIEGLYYNQNFIMKQSNPVTATDNYLDMWGKSLNIGPRKDATGAKGSIIFGRETPFDEDIKIPKGTIVSTNENIIGKLITAATKQDVFLKKGNLEVQVPAKTIETGIDTNLPKNSLTIINNPPVGIEYVKQPEPFRDGTDRETDKEYFKRFKKDKFYGTVDAFEKRALEVPGISFAKTLENNRGPGTTDVLIGTETGIPSDELLEKTLNHLLEKRPLCCDLGVIKANIYKFNADIKVKLKEGLSLDSKINGVPIIERIKQAIRIYLKSIGIDGVIVLAGISAAIYCLDEITDVNILSPKENIEITNNSMAEEGDINVTV